MVRAHGWVFVGTLVTLGACDWLNPSKVDEAEPIAAEPIAAEPIPPEPAIAATADAPAKPTKPTPTTVIAEPDSPSVDPTPPPLPAPSEFDELLVRLIGAPQPAAAGEPSVDEMNKAAWADYKAKRYPLAVAQFARVAARDPAWKHAHNMACAFALAGEVDDARVALAESIRRGGEAAKASAKKDSDLAAVRKLDWFAPLLAGESTPTPTIAEADAIAAADEGDEGEDEDDLTPANCPPGIDRDEIHHCFFDVLAPFSFVPVVFDKPITLDIAVPARPAKQRWKTASGKIPMKELRAELGIQHTTETYDLSRAPDVMTYSPDDFADFPLDFVDTPLEDGADAKPFFWWPEDGTAILVIPHKQKLGKLRFNGAILARKTDAGWRATNLEVTLDEQEGWVHASVLESGLGFRFDGLELFTLTQVEDQRRLCRIRWEQGALARACVTKWTEVTI
jgi:hypothetical protein